MSISPEALAITLTWPWSRLTIAAGPVFVLDAQPGLDVNGMHRLVAEAAALHGAGALFEFAACIRGLDTAALAAAARQHLRLDDPAVAGVRHLRPQHLQEQARRALPIVPCLRTPEASCFVTASGARKGPAFRFSAKAFALSL